MTGATLVVVAVWVGGQAAPGLEPALHSAREAARAAGLHVVSAAEAARRVTAAYGPTGPAVDAAWSARVRRGLLRGREAWLAQDYPRAVRDLQAGLDQAYAGLDQASRQQPEFLADIVHAAMLLGRSLAADGQAVAADAAFDGVVRRFPRFPFNDAEYPPPLLVAIDERRRTLSLRSGSVDVRLAGRLPADHDRCSVHLDGVPHGFPPTTIEPVAPGIHRLTVLCPAGFASRPLLVPVSRGRARMTYVFGGDEALRPGPAAALGPGWSLAGPPPAAGQALALRTASDAALLVGPDPASAGSSLRARLVRQDGTGPDAGVTLDPADPGRSALALLAPATLPPPREAPAPFGPAVLLWSAAGRAAAGAVAGGLALAADGDLAACKDDVTCAAGDDLGDRKRSVVRRSLAADVLLGSAAVAGLSGLVWHLLARPTSPQ